MITANQLKEQLNIEDIMRVVAELGGEPISENEEYIVYMTGDHHLNWSEGSPKLYLYKQTKSFYSYTTSTSYDIIGLVEARWQMQNIVYSFGDVLKYIASIVGLSDESFAPNDIITQPAWKSLVKRYTKPHSPTFQGKVYGKDELGLFLPYYHPLFLNDNISKDTMDKFQIGYYPPKQQISIPVFNQKGDLVGVHCRNTNQEIVDRGYKYMPLQTCSTQYKFKTSEVLYGENVNAPWIEKAKKVILLESPKGVLQADTYGCHLALGMFGLNLSKHNRDKIVAMGVNEVIVGIDKDYADEGQDKFDQYVKTAQKIAKMFKGFAKCTILYDKDSVLGIKESPTDRGKDIFCKLYKERVEIPT